MLYEMISPVTLDPVAEVDTDGDTREAMITSVNQPLADKTEGLPESQILQEIRADAKRGDGTIGHLSSRPTWSWYEWLVIDEDDDAAAGDEQGSEAEAPAEDPEGVGGAEG